MISIEELEKVLSKYRINKPKYRGTSVEHKSLPSMLTTFRELIVDDIPPTQTEFLENFRKKYPDIRFRGVPSRLKRAYLSYVREYHLGFLLRAQFDTVIYDEKTDLFGVDYIIQYRDHKFNIHAFVNTENGKYWRSIKNGRHNFVGHHLDLPMNLDSGKRVGKFIFYTEDDVKLLKEQMDIIVEGEANEKVEDWRV